VPTYYLDPVIRVTHEVIEVRRPSYRMFAVREIRHVYAVRGRTDWTRLSPSSTGLIGVVATAVLTSRPVIGSTSWSMAAVGGAACLSIAWTVIWWAHMRPHELRAIYRDQLICLFESHDGRSFREVTRAVARAVEESANV